MAELEIRLSVDPKTGKKNVIIAYRSDDGALPMEHEEDHRRIVDRLIEGGALAASELGSVVVERKEGIVVAEEPPREAVIDERESIEQEQ